MELSRNRIARSSYQADLGKPAFTEFFGGQPGGRTDIRVNGRDRQLVNVKSRNYRLEIGFPGEYPTGNRRPIVLFRKRSEHEFDCRLLMPSDADYRAAASSLDAVSRPTRTSAMRRGTLTHAEMRAVWPDCPLL